MESTNQQSAEGWEYISSIVDIPPIFVTLLSPDQDKSVRYLRP